MGTPRRCFSEESNGGTSTMRDRTDTRGTPGQRSLYCDGHANARWYERRSMTGLRPLRPVPITNTGRSNPSGRSSALIAATAPGDHASTASVAAWARVP